MTKSTDKSLIEDTEIAAEDLAEDLIEDDDAADIDEAAALAAKEQAERALADRAADVDEAAARAQLAQAAAQIRALQKLRKTVR